MDVGDGCGKTAIHVHVAKSLHRYEPPASKDAGWWEGVVGRGDGKGWWEEVMERGGGRGEWRVNVHEGSHCDCWRTAHAHAEKTRAP
jgi:hypothetical protein